MRKIMIRAWDKKDELVIDDIISTLGCGDSRFTSQIYNFQISDMMTKGDDSRFEFQQFIGIQDKNYRDIYEGDYVQILGSHGSKPISGIYEVFYKDTGFHLRREVDGIIEYEEFNDSDEITLFRKPHSE